MGHLRDTCLLLGVVSLVALGSHYRAGSVNPSPSASPTSQVEVQEPRGATLLERLLVDDKRETCSHFYYDGQEERYLALPEDSAERSFLRGLAYHARGQFERAQGEILQAIDIDPEDERFHFHLAEVERSLGHPKRALEAIEAALELNPNLYQALAERSWSRAALGQHKEGEEDWKRYLSYRPSTVYEYAHLSQQLRLRGEHVRAIRIADEGLVRYPEDAFLLVRRGEALCDLGRFADALEAFEDTVGEDDEWWADRLKFRARAREALGGDPSSDLRRVRALSQDSLP